MGHGPLSPLDLPVYVGEVISMLNSPGNLAYLQTVTLNNASDYQANGLLSDYIGWTNGLMDYLANGLGLGLGVR